MEALHTSNKDILYEKVDGIWDWTVRTTSTDMRSQHYVDIVSLSILSYTLGAWPFIGSQPITVRQSHDIQCTMYQLGYGRGVVELKAHAAQLHVGWNM